MAFIYDFFKSVNITDYNLIVILIKAVYFIKMQNGDNYNKIKIKIYQKPIKRLMYLSFSTRFNIVFVISQFNKNNVNLQIRNIKVVKKIVHYSFHSKNKEALNTFSLFGLIDYRDSNFAKNFENKKLIMKYCYFINKVIEFWCEKK